MHPCTDETFAIKAGAQHCLALVMPDAMPRGAGVSGATDAWDFGIGAGFYVDATEAPWWAHYRMESYVTGELRELAAAGLPIDGARLGIFGQSMGGHGALTLALRDPGLYRSVSAFAPIAAPTRCPWGEKASSGYLGADREAWKQHDASELVAHADAPSSRTASSSIRGLPISSSRPSWTPTCSKPPVRRAASR